MADPNKTRVTILTGTYRIKGYIELMPGARVTDYMVEAKDFIAATEAEVWELGDRKVMSAPFLNEDRKSTRLNSSHLVISYAVFCLKKKTQTPISTTSSAQPAAIPINMRRSSASMT